MKNAIVGVGIALCLSSGAARAQVTTEGVFGWNVIQNRIDVVGTVTKVDFADGSFFGLDGDRDWSLFVQPDPNFDWVLFNRAGVRNADGLIECEVQPPGQVLGQGLNSRAAMNNYYQSLVGEHVTVSGVWAEDLSHDNKTELHSLVSIFVTHGPFAPPYNSISYRTKFIVFSNSSSFDLISRPIMPPFNRVNWNASFSAQFPDAPADVAPGRMQDYAFYQELDGSGGKQFSLSSTTPGIVSLSASIQSGLESSGQGFYFSEMEIGPGAAFISQTVPTTMTVGQPYDVSVTMKMLEGGVGVWLPANRYALGAQNPQDNATWGLNRVGIPAAVGLMDNVTFNFRVTAPAVPGIYNFQWRMVQDGVRWLGNYTPNVQVVVGPCNGSTCAGGCCDGAFCRQNTDATCGLGGTACFSCIGGGTCSAGACVCVPLCGNANCGTPDGCGGFCPPCCPGCITP